MLHGLIIKGVAGTLAAAMLSGWGAAWAGAVAGGHGTARPGCITAPIGAMSATRMAGTHHASPAPRGLADGSCGTRRS